MRSVGSIDATAMNRLEVLYKECVKLNINLIFSHVNKQPYELMKKSGFISQVGAENFCKHIDDALKRVQELQ